MLSDVSVRGRAKLSWQTPNLEPQHNNSLRGDFNRYRLCIHGLWHWIQFQTKRQGSSETLSGSSVTCVVDLDVIFSRVFDDGGKSTAFFIEIDGLNKLHSIKIASSMSKSASWDNPNEPSQHSMNRENNSSEINRTPIEIVTCSL